MNRLFTFCLLAVASVLGMAAQGIYDIKVKDDVGQEVSMGDYKGKVLLIVNTATRCGFTPQYKELEALYEKYASAGFEILDFPCNQFGQQAPGTIEEIHQYCMVNFDIRFPQFDKIDVNGPQESPLFAYLKAQRGFAGFDLNDQRGKMMDGMLRKKDADYDKKPDIKWNFTKFLVARDGRVLKRYEPTDDMGTVDADISKALAPGAEVFATKSGKLVTFYPLIHASIRLVVDGTEIEIDPVGKLGNRQTDYAQVPKADYILVTHEHRDHFDPDAIGVLTAEGTTLLTNRRCADMLGRGRVMANGETVSILDGRMTVEAVPAYNTTEGRTQFHPKGRDNGYILTFDGLRIYIAGDTEDIPEMDNIRDIDIAFMPCNQPYTMTTEQLVSAARRVKPRVLYPYHYGDTDLSGVAAQLQGDGIDVRVLAFD